MNNKNSTRRMKFINAAVNKLIFRPRKDDRMFPIIDYCHNPVEGCLHGCIYCWARRKAKNKLKNTSFRPQLNRKKLKERFKPGYLIFEVDNGDLWGDWVPREWISAVLGYVRKYPKVYFLFLTKNPARYHEFLDYFPENAVLGATIETNRDDLYKKYRISRAPLPSERYRAMKELDWDLKIISIEPILKFELEGFVKWIVDIDPLLVFVGYDNWNNKLPEPSLAETLKLIDRLEHTTIVIKKTIRRAWYESYSSILTFIGVVESEER